MLEISKLGIEYDIAQLNDAPDSIIVVLSDFLNTMFKTLKKQQLISI